MADLTQRQTGLRQRQEEAEARRRKTMIWLAGGLIVAAIPLAGLFYKEIKNSEWAAQAALKPSFAGRNKGGIQAQSPQAMQASAPAAPAADTGNFLDYVQTPPSAKPPPKPAAPRPAPAAPKPAPPPKMKMAAAPKPAAKALPLRAPGTSYYKIPRIKGGPAWAPGGPLNKSKFQIPNAGGGAGAGNWMGTGAGGSSGFSPDSSSEGSLPNQVIPDP